jgi:hypothetical protein
MLKYLTKEKEEEEKKTLNVVTQKPNGGPIAPL